MSTPACATAHRLLARSTANAPRKGQSGDTQRGCVEMVRKTHLRDLSQLRPGSSALLPRIIDGELHRRRRGVHGSPSAPTASSVMANGISRTRRANRDAAGTFCSEEAFTASRAAPALEAQRDFKGAGDLFAVGTGFVLTDSLGSVVEHFLGNTRCRRTSSSKCAILPTFDAAASSSCCTSRADAWRGDELTRGTSRRAPGFERVRRAPREVATEVWRQKLASRSDSKGGVVWNPELSEFQHGSVILARSQDCLCPPVRLPQTLALPPI